MASPKPPNAKTSSEKPKHLSGNLVDVGCMAKALNGQGEAATTPGKSPANSENGVPQFLGSSSAPQAGQQPGGGISPAGANPAGQTPRTGPANPNSNSPNTDISPEQAAEVARAEKVNDAAKQCVPSSSTQAFGLAMSGGEVVKFDNAGDSKAQEALKEVQVRSGKTVKAKVTGTMQDRATVRVESVEVKGKRAS
jgi:hypothetical protein